MSTYRNLENKRRSNDVKSLKFELIPMPATMNAIVEQGLIQKNDTVLEHIETVKPAIDEFVRHMLNEGLSRFTYNFGDFAKNWLKRRDPEVTQDEKDKYNKAREDLIKKISSCCKGGSFMGISGTGGLKSAKFINNALPVFINEYFDGEAKAEMLNSCNALNSLTAYLSKYMTTRCTALETWAPDRVFENFEIYMKNIPAIKHFLDSEYAKDFLDKFPEFEDFQYPEYYNSYLTQSDIDRYNRILGGVFNSEQKLEVMGYNQYVNELNQKNRADKSYTGEYYNGLAPLYKQILMPTEKAFEIKKITSDEEVKSLLDKMFLFFSDESFSEMIEGIRSADPSGVFVRGINLNYLSHMMYGDYNAIQNKVYDAFVTEQEELMAQFKYKKDKKPYEKAIAKAISHIHETYYSFAYLESLMNDNKIMDAYITSLMELKYLVLDAMEDVKAHGCMKENTKVYRNAEIISYIIRYLDNVLDFRRQLSWIHKEESKEVPNEDVLFYSKFCNRYKTIGTACGAYNYIHNYLVLKPSDISKERIMAFGRSSKIDNLWYNPDTGFQQKSFSIMEMDGKYYFVELSPLLSNTIFPTIVEESKLHVDLMGMQKSQASVKIFGRALLKDTKAAEFFENNPNEDVFFVTDKRVNKPFEISRRVYEIWKDKLYKEPDDKKKMTEEEKAEQKENLRLYLETIIRMCSEFQRFRSFSFDFGPAESYKSFNEFCNEADTYMAVSTFVHVDRAQIEEEIEAGRLLAFLISSRNMYTNKKNKKAYAMVFLDIIEQTKTGRMDIRFNSKPYISFRSACIPYYCTHPKGSIVLNKAYKNGNKIEEEVYVPLLAYLNGEIEKNILSYKALYALENDLVTHHVTKIDLAKDRRYTQDKFFLNISYTLNCAISKSAKNTITEEVTASMKDGFNTLVVSRGIEDMLYYSLFDNDHNLIESKSLNVLFGTDYKNKLEVLGEDRQKSKIEKWNYTKKIKDIKEAYVNTAITKIIRIAVENNAVIVIEKLSEYFINKAAAIDNQVFSIFETKLEERLCNYRRRDIPSGEWGSYTNPMQLASKKEKGNNQNGILFRVNPAYTSNMCPVTGFVNLFDLKEMNTNDIRRRNFLERFDKISFNSEYNCFVFDMDYNNFHLKNNDFDEKLKKTKWTLYIGKPMTLFNKQIKAYEYLEDPCKELVQLLRENKISEEDIKVADLSDKMVRMLATIFENSVKYNTVKACDGNLMEYYSSVATMDDIFESPADIKTENLARKFWFTLNDSEKEKDQSIRWVNYAQENF